jgi:hypothetical protein
LLFLSYSRHDMAVAVGLRDRLEAAGFSSVFHDVDPKAGIAAGADWEQTLWYELRRCSAVVFLSSLHSAASPWCLAELAVARSAGKPVFPVILDGDVPSLLRDTQAVSLSDGLPTAVQRLTSGLHRAGLDPLDSFAWDDSRSPYPGLAAFEEADAAVFFGRQEQIGQLEQLLHSPLPDGARRIAVVGPSGSGKSSLVRAGLLPRLRRRPEQRIAVDPLTGSVLERNHARTSPGWDSRSGRASGQRSPPGRSAGATVCNPPSRYDICI